MLIKHLSRAGFTRPTNLQQPAKFNYRDAAVGAKRSNIEILRAFATTPCALELDLCGQ